MMPPPYSCPIVNVMDCAAPDEVLPAVVVSEMMGVVLVQPAISMVSTAVILVKPCFMFQLFGLLQCGKVCIWCSLIYDQYQQLIIPGNKLARSIAGFEHFFLHEKINRL